MSNTTSAPPSVKTPTSLHVSAPGSDLSVDLPVTDGAIRANDLRKIPTAEGGLLSYDPAFLKHLQDLRFTGEILAMPEGSTRSFIRSTRQSSCAPGFSILSSGYSGCCS